MSEQQITKLGLMMLGLGFCAGTFFGFLVRGWLAELRAEKGADA